MLFTVRKYLTVVEQIHHDLGPEFSQVVPEVIGETVVVIDQKQHETPAGREEPLLSRNRAAKESG